MNQQEKLTSQRWNSLLDAWEEEVGGVLDRLNTLTADLPDPLSQLWTVPGLTHTDEQVAEEGHLRVDLNHELLGEEVRSFILVV